MLDSLTGTLTSTKRQPDINEASTRHQRSVNQTSTTRQRSVNRTSIGALCRRERRDVGFVGPSRLAPRGLADHKAESRYRMGPVGWTDQGAGLGRGIVRRCCVGGGAVGSARTQRSITSRWDAFSFHLRHVRDLRSTANDNDDGDVLRNVSSVGPPFQLEVGNPTTLNRIVSVHVAHRSSFVALAESSALMKCVNCGKDLPHGSSSRRRFCDSVCRTESWRIEAERSAQQEPVRKRNGMKNGTSATSASARTEGSLRRAQHRAENPVPQRIPMEAQLAQLAPVGAVG
jgi:hypothetical protein